MLEHKYMLHSRAPTQFMWKNLSESPGAISPKVGTIRKLPNRTQDAVAREFARHDDGPSL